MNNETPLDEVMEKPLSDDIIQQMNSDEGNKKSAALMLSNINPMQANLLERLLKTMQIEYVWVTKGVRKENDEPQSRRQGLNDQSD